MIFIFAAMALAGGASAVLAIWTVWIAWKNPRKLLEVYEKLRRDDDPPGTSRPLLRYRCIIALSLIGYGMFIFGGISSALFWLPSSWAMHDQDGGWTTYRALIAIMVALPGALVFSYLLLDYCRLKLRDQIRREERPA